MADVFYKYLEGKDTPQVVSQPDDTVILGVDFLPGGRTRLLCSGTDGGTEEDMTFHLVRMTYDSDPVDVGSMVYVGAMPTESDRDRLLIFHEVFPAE